MADSPELPLSDPAKAATPEPAKEPAKAEPAKAAAAEPAKAEPAKEPAAEPAKEPAKAEPAAEPAPVDYAKTIADVKLPEGVTLDPALAKAGADLFAEMKLPADQAGKLVDFFAQQQKAGAEGNAKAFASQVQAWKAAAEKGTTAEERGQAKEAASAVFTKEELQVMETFGITNRLGFIKSMAKVATAIKEDRFVPGNASAPNGHDARTHYPNSNMNP
jgi:hypothetical protein